VAINLGVENPAIIIGLESLVVFDRKDGVIAAEYTDLSLTKL
jgi:hypothetical protein